MLDLLGYTQKEFTEKFENRFSLMVYKEDRERVLKEIHEQIEQGDFDICEYRIEKKDGSLIWVHDDGHFVVDEHGRECFYVVISDINNHILHNQALEVRSQDLEHLVSSIPAGIVVFRKDKNRLHQVATNELAKRSFGIPEGFFDSAKQSDFLETVYFDDVKRVSLLMRSVLYREQVTYTARFRQSDGCYHWLHIDIKTVKENDEKALMYAVISDVTKEKENELYLEEKNRQELKNYYQSLQSKLYDNPHSVLPCHVNLSHDQVYISKEIEKKTWLHLDKTSYEHLLKSIVVYFYHPAENKNFLNSFSIASLLKLFKEEQTYISYRCQCKPSKQKNVLWCKMSISIGENPVTHEIEGVFSIEDVDMLIKDEQIMQHLTDREFDFISLVNVLDHTYHEHYLGTFYKNLIDYDPKMGLRIWDIKEIIKKGMKFWVHPDDQERYSQEMQLENLVKDLTHEAFVDKTFKGLVNGKELYKQISYSYLDETREWILIQIRDITELTLKQQNEFEERLAVEKALRFEADQANEMKSSFLSNVSHDMRTPLNAILGYADLAKVNTDIEKKNEYLDKIAIASDTLKSLINDTLDLQKIENGRTILKMKDVNCHEILESIITAVQPTMEEKGITFEVDTSQAVDCVVKIDKIKAQEVFINLLSNAAKFTPEGGHVLLKVESELISSVCCVRE